MASLSIIIPTYNRLVYLRDLLPFVRSALKGRDYEIIVCDNASHDDTEGFIHSLDYSNLRYFRHAENKGVDFNFLFGLDQAQKEYSWILSSDDSFDVSKVNAFFDFLDQGDFDFLLLDMLRCDKNLEPFASHHWFLEPSGKYDLRSKNEEFFFLRANPLLGVYFGYISSLVFRTSSLRKISFDDTFRNSFFSFSYFAYIMVLRGYKFGYFKEFFILNRGYNDSVINQNISLRKRIHVRHMVDINGFAMFYTLLESKPLMAASYSSLIKKNYKFYDVLKVIVFSDKFFLRRIILPFFRKHNVRLYLVNFFYFIKNVFVFVYLLRLKYGKSKRILPRWFLGR